MPAHRVRAQASTSRAPRRVGTALAVAITATGSGLGEAPAAGRRPTHLLTLAGTVTEPTRGGTAAGDPACLLHFSLRRLGGTSWNRTADLWLEVADPREGRKEPLVGSVHLDLDDTGGARRTMRIEGVDCDGLRPLDLRFACGTDDGRCPAGTRIRLRNFDRLEIARDLLTFD